MTAASTAVPAARVRGLTKRYGRQLALDGVDLEVAPGELRGLLGLNGAGKTTLLRTLFGLVRADAGSVELLGHPLTRRRRRPLHGVAGFVEEPAFYAYLTGAANLELLAELDGRGPERIDDALQRVGLGGARTIVEPVEPPRERLTSTAPRIDRVGYGRRYRTSGVDPEESISVAMLCANASGRERNGW